MNDRLLVMKFDLTVWGGTFWFREHSCRLIGRNASLVAAIHSGGLKRAEREVCRDCGQSALGANRE